LPPLVSVLIVSYNHERFIGEAIESVLKQKTSFEFEVVIADDCSKDATVSIIQQFSREYPNIIQPFFNPQNLGVQNNCIKILPHCKGQYLAICDGDDYWLDDLKLQKQVDFLNQHPQHSMCFSNAYNFFEDGRKIDYLRKHFQIEIKKEYSWQDLLGNNFIPSGTILYRKKYFPLTGEKGLFFNEVMKEIYAPDGFWNLLFALNGTVAFQDEYYSVRRVHKKGLVSTKSANEKFKRVIADLRTLKKYPFNDLVKEKLEERSLERMMDYGDYLFYSDQFVAARKTIWRIFRKGKKLDQQPIGLINFLRKYKYFKYANWLNDLILNLRSVR